MVVVTGAAGFIGSCLVRKLNDEGLTNLILVDEFHSTAKARNLEHKTFAEKIDRTLFLKWFEANGALVSFVYHLGARTDTTEKDQSIFDELNVAYSQAIWNNCSRFQIPLIYASSAATYGLGEFGFEDNHTVIHQLAPLNPYGVSKNDFDIWAMKQTTAPPKWAGLKFFNVYGPNEYHKGRMASVIFHTVRQIKATGGMKLFRSHHADYQDGAQKRDFVYVKDVVDVCYFLREHKVSNGLYNLGIGKARTFWDLAENTFKAMGLAPNISFIDTPLDIRDTYQYYTQANMDKLIQAGYDRPFTELEAGIQDYVKQYLLEENIW